MAKKINTEATEVKEEEVQVTEQAAEPKAKKAEVTPEVTEEAKEDAKEEAVEAAPEAVAEETKAVQVSDKEDKVLSPDEDIAHKTSRFAHELAKASKKAKQEMYRSEHVITEYGDDDVETESTLLKKDYLELVASSKSQKILEGKVVGFRYAGETRKSTILAEIEYGTGLYTILIPSYLMYDYEMSQYVEPDMIQRVENNIMRRIGGRIKFIIRHVDEATQTAYADRLMAQSIIGHDNYIRLTRDGKPRIIEGQIVKGQVIYTTSKGIVVDALGTDISIRKEELSHSYVGDARDEYKVGDSVNVKIGKIKEVLVEKNETNYKLIKATGSVKDAKVNHKERLYPQFKIDGVYAATVTYVEEAGAFCRLKGEVDCLVALPRFGENPVRGDERIVKITEKDDERMYLYGIFLSN